MYLLDTNVVSELRKIKPHGAVSAWFDGTPADLIQIPAVVLGELQAGVEKTRLQDPLKANEIEQWIDRIMRTWMVQGMEVRHSASGAASWLAHPMTLPPMP
jgi:hypothetical protein